MSELSLCRMYIDQSMYRRKSKLAHQRNFSFYLLNKAGEIRRRYFLGLKEKKMSEPANLELF